MGEPDFEINVPPHVGHTKTDLGLKSPSKDRRSGRSGVRTRYLLHSGAPVRYNWQNESNKSK